MPRPPFFFFFVNVLRLLLIRAPCVPGANISEVPNSAVGQPRNFHIPPEAPNLSWVGDPGSALVSVLLSTSKKNFSKPKKKIPPAKKKKSGERKITGRPHKKKKKNVIRL